MYRSTLYFFVVLWGSLTFIRAVFGFLRHPLTFFYQKKREGELLIIPVTPYSHLSLGSSVLSRNQFNSRLFTSGDYGGGSYISAPINVKPSPTQYGMGEALPGDFAKFVPWVGHLIWTKFHVFS